ncbi:HutD family protein, partial [Phenylobacterium sp.]
MRILRAVNRTPMPWKNGGGVTREVAIWPPTA